MNAPVVTLCTNFGLADGYVGAMKGVILAICPNAVLVDISHEIPPQDIATGAYVMSAACRRFPPGAVHIGVVDPGVGTERRGMILRAGGMFYVGPDNGLFSFALSEMESAWSLEAPPDASSTFHGRDLFAPTAARLACGADPNALGRAMTNPVKLDAWEKRSSPLKTEGCVIHIDRFGNVVTNLRPDDFPKGVKRLEIFGAPSEMAPPWPIAVGRVYSDVAVGEPVWLVGSDGSYELAIRNGNAARTYGIRRGCGVVGTKKL